MGPFFMHFLIRVIDFTFWHIMDYVLSIHNKGKEESEMTDKELRKLRRIDLLNILLAQSREIDQLREKLRETEAALQDKTLMIDKAGSIAEASLQLSGIFRAAELACQQYTDNIRLLSERQEALLEQQERADIVS